MYIVTRNFLKTILCFNGRKLKGLDVVNDSLEVDCLY